MHVSCGERARARAPILDGDRSHLGACPLVSNPAAPARFKTPILSASCGVEFFQFPSVIWTAYQLCVTDRRVSTVLVLSSTA